MKERLPGGRAAGMRVSDFDPVQLAHGAEHELEHTDDRALAREIAMDHLAEDPDYYVKLATIESNPSGDVLVVGDVHGCAEELAVVLGAVDLDQLSHVVFAGDLLDKGPDPVAVVRMARELSQVVDVVLVEGNHELGHRRWREAMERGRGRKASRMRWADEAYEVVRALCKADIDFLDSAVLYERLDAHGALAVHGGIPPKMKKLPPRDLGNVASLPTRRRSLALWMEEIRYVSPKGDPVERPSKRDRFWAETYDGRFGTVLFGHTPHKRAEEPVGFPYAIGLDLGCATGNKLAAALLTPGAPAEFVVAPSTARKNPPAVKVLPAIGDPNYWIGYVQVGDRMLPASASRQPGEALQEARHG